MRHPLPLAALFLTSLLPTNAYAQAPETAVPAPAAAPTPSPDPPAAAPAAPDTASPSIGVPVGVRRSMRGSRVTFGLDVNLEGGIGSLLSRGGVSAFGRARIGLLTEIDPYDPRRSPLFVAIGGFYEASDLSAATLGIQMDIIHMSSGGWFQMGPMIDAINGEPGLMLAVGWSLVGVELQRRVIADDRALGDDLVETAIFGKVRVPITIILKALAR